MDLDDVVVEGIGNGAAGIRSIRSVIALGGSGHSQAFMRADSIVGAPPNALNVSLMHPRSSATYVPVPYHPFHPFVIVEVHVLVHVRCSDPLLERRRPVNEETAEARAVSQGVLPAAGAFG